MLSTVLVNIEERFLLKTLVSHPIMVHEGIITITPIGTPYIYAVYNIDWPINQRVRYKHYAS
jgi:hypothetical protein